MHKNLRSLIDTLAAENDIVTVSAPVDSHLEIAEIHRRVIAGGGKALLFQKVKGSKFPVVTNLFGTRRRIDLAFGPKPELFVRRAVAAVTEAVPPTLAKVWKFRGLGSAALRIGTSRQTRVPVSAVRQSPANLDELPLLQLWPEDGGHFITLPLVFTESPVSGKSNLGMYRMQRYSASETGIHWQIGKGGGFHYHEAEKSGRALPATVFLGGPPALIVAAIAPLPEDVPELLLASLIAGEKIAISSKKASNGHNLIGEAEFAIIGSVAPNERRAEGPFGDHYGYYSLRHDYPIFRASEVLHRKDAIYPATVVGKPRQEDFFIGDYLQELLSPLFPLVMPAVRDLWSYGETGFHSLAAAVVRERYAREALSAGFRILGEGQLSLTKFLLLTDEPVNLRNFRKLFEHILARVEWSRDFFIFGQTAFDTLDYTSGKINHGSKAILMGLGPAIRELPHEFRGELPQGVRRAESFCAGCLVLEIEDGLSLENVAKAAGFAPWQMIVILDDASAAADPSRFLWETWTRFDPATHVFAAKTWTERSHIGFESPIVIDARMKPNFPAVVEPEEATVKLVDDRWSEYFAESDPLP